MRYSDERPTLPDAPPAPDKPEPPPASPWRLDRYDVLFELARGGMGAVYVARLRGAHRFDRLVAIKRLSVDHGSASDVSAFLDEARLTARIHHPNVVQTLDLGEEDGAPFLVMQLVQGVSLAQLFARLAITGERLDPDLATWIIAQAASGLHAAHELCGDGGVPLRLVHRDVSPQNILISYEGRVHVADFGVAKFAERDTSTQAGIVKGKFRYMSPEQAHADPVDRRSDLFSIGIVLYEALTGRRPFAGEGPANIVLQIVASEPTDPRAIVPDIPDALVKVTMRCLEKDPEDRWGTAAELADALRKHLRARRAVDETEVAALLDRLFARERVAFEERLRPGAPAESAVRRVGEVASPSEPASVQASHVSITGPRVTRARTVRRVALAGMAVGVAAGAWVSWPKSGPSPPATSAVEVPLPRPSATSLPTEPVASSPMPPASLASARSTAPPPPAGSGRSKKQNGAAREAGAPHRATPPSSTPSPAGSAEGVPFDSL